MLVPVTVISSRTDSGAYMTRASDDSGVSNTIYINTDFIMSMRRSHVKEDAANYVYAGNRDIVTLQIKDDSGATATKWLEIPLADAYNLLGSAPMAVSRSYASDSGICSDFVEVAPLSSLICSVTMSLYPAYI